MNKLIHLFLLFLLFLLNPIIIYIGGIIIRIVTVICLSVYLSIYPLNKITFCTK